MAIREDLVASAAQFLQDPSVASSSVENRLSFLRSKNLTQEEIDVAMARAGGHAPPVTSPAYAGAPPPPPPSGFPQQYYPYPPGSWQQPPPPKRDWRDWFIMATVVSGVGYGLYTLGKRYVYPAIAPPTPEKLEQDKKTIEEQFDRAFALVEQLAKDTESLKKAEQDRTEKLDAAIAELDTVMTDLKAANRRREDDAQRIRDEMQGLKDAIPKALDNQKLLTDNRLREISSEMGSLKTLVSQRMAPPAAAAPAPAPAPAPVSSYVRPSVSSAASTPAAAAHSAAPATTNGNSAATTPAAEEAPKPATPASSFSRSSITAGLSSSGNKPSIPAWQMAMANKSAGSSATKSDEAGGSSSSAA